MTTTNDDSTRVAHSANGNGPAILLPCGCTGPDSHICATPYGICSRCDDERRIVEGDSVKGAGLCDECWLEHEEKDRKSERRAEFDGLFREFHSEITGTITREVLANVPAELRAEAERDAIFSAGAARKARAKTETDKTHPVPTAHDHWARRHASDSNFSGAYKHVPGIGWHRWDGIVWTGGVNEILREHFDTVEGMYSDWLPGFTDAETKKAAFKALVSAANMPVAECTLKAMAAMPEFHANAGAFDADHRILVTPDGVMASDSMSLMKHAPERLVMRCTRGSWRKDKETGTRWAQFMREVFPTTDMHDFMRRLLGYIVFGHRDEHIFPIFAGPGGNGKSVMVDTLVYAMGDYASVASTDLILWSRNDRHPEEKMVLHGRRLVAASELPEGRRLNEALVKQITGSQEIRARHLYKSEISFPRTWVVTLDTNHVPRVDGTDEAIWQRIVLITFGQQFRGTEREEKGLGAKLRNNPDDVISWCATGWRDYCDGGMRIPNQVHEETWKYRNDQDYIGQFVKESRDSGLVSEMLASATSRFCGDFHDITARKLNKLLTDRGVNVGRGTGNVMVVRW